MRCFRAPTVVLASLGTMVVSIAGAAPLPEGAQGLSKTSQQRYEWCKANLLDAYERVGNRNAKWDEHARELLAAATEGISKRPGRARNEVTVVMDSYRKAAAAGCTEPLLQYAYGCMVTYKSHPGAAPKMKNSAYHAFWRCDSLAQAARGKLSLAVVEESKKEEYKKEAQAFWTEAMALLPEVYKDDQLPREFALDLLATLGEMGAHLGHDRAVVWGATSKALGPKRAGSGIALNLEGHFWLAYAWDARSAKRTALVENERLRLFRARLERASDVLDKAWSQKPHVEVALDMMQLARSQGALRERMEKWFERAVQEDPDDYRPYERKLQFLEPKWHGSAEEMLEFGRKTLAADQWAGHYRILADAHWSLAASSGSRSDYFETPGAWDEVNTVYERFLTKYPQASEDRSKFAQMAAWSGQWKEADRQFKALKSARASYFVGGVKGFNEMRALIESKLKK